ncbi:hypothetical protein HUU59_05270 [bacterium]|nr:hypothetical protein [bacterium]
MSNLHWIPLFIGLKQFRGSFLAIQLRVKRLDTIMKNCPYQSFAQQVM